MTLLNGAARMEIQSAFMAGASVLVLLYAILRERRDRTTLLYAALVATFGTWAAARGIERLGISWGMPLEAASLTLLGALTPMAAAAFAGREATLYRYRFALLLGPPLLCAAVIAGGPERPVVRTLTIAWAILGAISGAALLARPVVDDPGSPAATRLRFLAAAHAVIVAGAVADVTLAAFGGPRVASLLAPLLYLYAGYLHLLPVRVADLRRLMGNALALGILALFVASLFGALWLWVGPRLDLFLFNAFVVSFVLLLGIDPVRSRMQRWIERRFVAGRLELERTLRPLTERLSQIFTLDEFLQEVLEAVETSERLRASAIFLRDDPVVGFQQVASIGLAPRRRVNLIRAPAWVKALEDGQVLLREELEKERAETRAGAGLDRASVLLWTMDQLDAQLVLPLRAGQNLVGFWSLRDVDDSEPFSAVDVEFLHGVAEQMAATIENTKTFERVRARERFASLGEMAAGLAHEIRNPLATIRAATTLLEDPGNESPGEIRQVIVEEIERLDRVVGMFLDYARPSSQRQTIADPGEFVRTSVRSVSRLHPGEHVGLRIDIEDDLPPISADADQLERVIANVVENAYQALDFKGSLRVSARRAAPDGDLPEGIEIRIEDDGPGMDEPTAERAFIPFFTTRAQGTGLGLAICERLVRGLGGSIRLTSRPAEGTTVFIRIPSDASGSRAPEGEECEA
ncbi:MAG: GAF domain-containing protein [Deltaproteobacteria bacterium]|nr:GAF domain-containing protein [Deltaproteobacteria bacterium]